MIWVEFTQVAREQEKEVRRKGRKGCWQHAGNSQEPQRGR